MHYRLLVSGIVSSVLCAQEGVPNSPIHETESPPLIRSMNPAQCAKGIDELIGLSLKNYPSIQVSRQMIAGADAQVEGAKWGYYPTPSVDVSQSSGRTGTTLRLDQPLWTGGKIDASVDIALSKKAESEHALGESGYLLVENLLRTVQSYLQADGNLDALQEGKKQLLILSEMLERRIDAGVSSMADRELLKSRISQINADISAAQMQRSMAHSQLELLVGERISCTVAFENKAVLTQEAPMDQMIQEMFATHPALKKLLAQITTAEAEKAKSKAVIWPNVSLRAEHLRGSVYTDAGTSDSLVYVALQMSPGAGLSALSTIQSAEAKVLQAKYEKQTKEQELSNAMMRDYNDYRAALERIEGMDQTIRASQNVLESYTRLFVAGKRQWLDLVNSSRELTQNKISLANLKATLVTSAYQLALKRGEMKLESGEKK